jgi:UDP-N-acetylglucosamine--N-acetylmuramyl-(pentapeptide) pyrophosphoryl-undecaprenol N-acetylglucosamine transferase
MGLPALLVPLKIAMDDHQTVNAMALSRLGAADILPESQFTPEQVKTTLEARLNDSTWLKSASAAAKTAGRPDAAAKLAELVISAASK